MMHIHLTAATGRSARHLTLLLALLPLSLSQAVHAGSITDTHTFRLGVADYDLDVTGRFSARGRSTQDIDFDRQLGLEESSNDIAFGYRWRFLEKWSLEAMYSRLEANGGKRVTEDFSWDGQEYTAGLGLDVKFNLDTYLVAVDYSFIRDERREFGVGFGVHAFDIGSVVQLEASIDETVERRRRSVSDLLAPLPNLRVFGTYAITPRWEVSAKTGWLSFNAQDYSGDYLFLKASTEYRFTRNFGLGAAYQLAEIDFKDASGHGEKRYDVELAGPRIYLTYGF